MPDSTTITPSNTNAPSAELDTTLPSYRKAFTELLPVIRAVGEDDFVPVNLDVMTIIYLIEAVTPRIAPHRATIVEELPKFPIQNIDQLGQYALALGHAHTTYCNSMKPSPILQALAEKAAPMREILVSEATTLIKRRVFPSNLLDNLQGPNGYRNLATDLLLIADKLRANFDAISKRTTLTLAELTEAENLAAQMNHEIGLRQQSSEGQAQAARDRQAAYTLTVKAYEQARAALAYVRREHGDADDIAPSLYAGRNNSNAKKKETESKPAATAEQAEHTQVTATHEPPAANTSNSAAPAHTPAPTASNTSNAATTANAVSNSTAHTVPTTGPFV